MSKRLYHKAEVPHLSLRDTGRAAVRGWAHPTPSASRPATPSAPGGLSPPQTARVRRRPRSERGVRRVVRPRRWTRRPAACTRRCRCSWLQGRTGAVTVIVSPRGDKRRRAVIKGSIIENRSLSAPNG